MYNALKERETQLLRQVEVLVQHCGMNNSYDKCYKQISVVFDNEVDILLSISKFGRIGLKGLSQESNLYKIEDYQQPNKDHEAFHKNISQDPTSKSPKESPESEKQIDKRKECEEAEKYTAPNVILACIEKQDPNLCQYENANKTLESVSRCSFTNESEMTAETNCDTVKNHQENLNNMVNSRSEPCVRETRSCTVSHARKLSMHQPVQVQQWMDQIISEPEIEPQPSNVMEHSHINLRPLSNT